MKHKTDVSAFYMAGMGCYVIHLDYTIMPLTDLIHICLYVEQTHFLELDHSGSQPSTCVFLFLGWLVLLFFIAAKLVCTTGTLFSVYIKLTISS